jgi:NTE family protein
MGKEMTMRKRLLKISDPVIIGLIMVLAGCANFSAVDKPIAKGTPYPPNRLSHQMENERSDDLLVLLGFSGGGTRAAAYAYGLLKALADTSIMTEHGQRSLLHEVDLLITASEQVLRESPDFQIFLRRTNGQIKLP